MKRFRALFSRGIGLHAREKEDAMGKVRQKFIESLDRELKAIYEAGGFEKRKAEAIWAQLERLEAEEARERTSV